MRDLRGVLSTIVVLTLTPFTPAMAQWQEQVAQQLAKAGEIAERDGFRLVEAPPTGSLSQGAIQSIPLELDERLEYMMFGVCDGDCTDLDLSLRDPAGTEIHADVETDDTPIIVVLPATSGAHRLAVTMVSCSVEPCLFGIGVYGREREVEPGSQTGGESHTHHGELREGDATLQGGEFVDRYPFHAQAGQILAADLSSGEFDPYLILVEPDGDHVENDDFDGSKAHSRLELEARESGEWTLLVTSFEAGETGAYRLTRTIGEGRTGPLPGSRSVSGSLGPEDGTLKSGELVDFYSLYGWRGDQVVLDLRSSQFDPYLILRSPSGDQEENDDHEGSPNRSFLSLTLAETGGHTVLVTSYEVGATGSYDLRIDRLGRNGGEGGSRTERGALTAEDDTLRSGEYLDLHSFQAQPGQRVHLELTSPDFDTYLILRLPDKEQFENDDRDGVGHSVIDREITEPGEHQVIVTSFQAGETGSYDLTISLEDSQGFSGAEEDPTPISPGRNAQGSLSSGDGRLEEGEFRDVYLFDGERGDSLVLEMTSGDFDTYLVLMDPGGNDTQNDDHEGDTSRSRIVMTLEESGPYRIIATSYKAGETGSYELSLRREVAEEASIPGDGRLGSAGGGRLFGVFAGVGDYGGRAAKLAYTAEDATRMRDALIRGAGMEPENGILLVDHDATVANFQRTIRQMTPNMGADDTFVLFFSGHGSQVARSEPQASDPDALDETLELYDQAITDDEMRDLLGGIHAGTTLVFLDACFSGGFAKDLISLPGRMGLFSSEEDVVSSVAAKFRSGGYLAAFLADGIGEGLADANHDGSVTALELSHYVQARYRRDLNSDASQDLARRAGPQVGYQHLVVDRGSLGLNKVLFRK